MPFKKLIKTGEFLCSRFNVEGRNHFNIEGRKKFPTFLSYYVLVFQDR